jgi:hypothetical protein
VKIALGDPQAAVDLYRRAIAIEPSALLWFNLSQAHGRAIDVEQHDTALAAAQSLDPAEVSELTARLAATRGGYVAELPLPQHRLRERLRSADASAAAAEVRRALAPGLLGRASWIAALAFVAAAALGVALRQRFEPSTSCPDCGTRLCRRCGTAHDTLRNGAAADPRCEACRRLRSEARARWESRRDGASAFSRARNGIAWLLPGLLGGSAGRPAIGLVAALAAAGALAFGFGSGAVLPDPASVGGAGALAFGVATGFCVAFYTALVVLNARLGRRSRG